MKSKFLSYIAASGDPAFFKSSSIVFLGSTVVNFLSYLFTVVVSRLLGPASFGEVAALTGFFLILSVPANTITTFMAKQSALHKGKDRMASVRHLMAFLDTWSLVFGLVVLAIFLALLPGISQYLKISEGIILVFSLLVPLNFVSAVSTGALQGLQAFKFLQYQNIFAALVKFVAAVVLVAMGFSVTGVVIALILSVSSSLLYGFLKTVQVTGPMKFFSAEGESDAKWSAMRGYLTIVFTNALLLAIVPNIDVVMAKHYLPAIQAGQYGALSTAGKILLYGVTAFATVLLPIASESHSQGTERGRKALWMSLGIISVVALICISVFSFVPGLVVRFVFGSAYLAIAPYLGLFALAMSFLALSTVFVNYFIATHRSAFLWSFLVAVLLQITGILMYHQSLEQIVTVMVISTGFLLLLMLGNYSLTPKIVYA